MDFKNERKAFFLISAVLLGGLALFAVVHSKQPPVKIYEHNNTIYFCPSGFSYSSVLKKCINENNESYCSQGFYFNIHKCKKRGINVLGSLDRKGISNRLLPKN
jgi:hypothetical protein